MEGHIKWRLRAWKFFRLWSKKEILLITIKYRIWALFFINDCPLTLSFWRFLFTVRIDVLIGLNQPDGAAKGLIKLNKLLKLFQLLLWREFELFDGKMLVLDFLVFEMLDFPKQEMILLAQVLKLMVDIGKNAALWCVTHEILY